MDLSLTKWVHTHSEASSANVTPFVNTHCLQPHCARVLFFCDPWVELQCTRDPIIDSKFIFFPDFQDIKHQSSGFQDIKLQLKTSTSCFERGMLRIRRPLAMLSTDIFWRGEDTPDTSVEITHFARWRGAVSFEQRVNRFRGRPK